MMAVASPLLLTRVAPELFAVVILRTITNALTIGKADTVSRLWEKSLNGGKKCLGLVHVFMRTVIALSLANRQARNE
jgi:hypothetical protein